MGVEVHTIQEGDGLSTLTLLLFTNYLLFVLFFMAFALFSQNFFSQCI